MKLRINESKYNLDWKEVGTETIYIGDERYRLPIYEKRLYNTVVIQVVPETDDNNEELIWTVYYTPEIGKAGFKCVESGFFSSGEAIDYVDNEFIGKFDIFDIVKNESTNKSNRYYVTDDDYIPLSNQPNSGYTKMQAIQRAQREAEEAAKRSGFNISVTAKWYHIMDSDYNICYELDNAI